jgi:anti-sigma B factor antagonist
MTARPLLSADLGAAVDSPVQCPFPVEDVRGCAVVRASGEVDIWSSPALLEALDAAARASDRIVIDLSAVTFLDSSGIATMVGALNLALRRPGGSLVLAGPRAIVRRVLQVVCLSDVFPTYASVDDAVEQLA